MFIKKAQLHEFAKFGAGLVAADFVFLLWFSMNTGPGVLLGIENNYAILPALLFDAALFIILVHYGWHIGKTPLMRERTYLVLVGLLFAFIALIHMVRVFSGTNLVIMGWVTPVWLSWIGTAVTAYLSYMSLRLALALKK